MIIENQARVVSYVFVDEHASHCVKGCVLITGALAARDERLAFPLHAKPTDDEDPVAVDAFFVHVGLQHGTRDGEPHFDKE
jgi:hypothetical protein